MNKLGHMIHMSNVEKYTPGTLDISDVPLPDGPYVEAKMVQQDLSW